MRKDYAEMTMDELIELEDDISFRLLADDAYYGSDSLEVAFDLEDLEEVTTEIKRRG